MCEQSVKKGYWFTARMWRNKSLTDWVSTHFLITWHNLHNTSLNEEHAEDSVASCFLIFVHDLERLHFFPLYMVNIQKVCTIFCNTCQLFAMAPGGHFYVVLKTLHNRILQSLKRTTKPSVDY